MVQWSVNGATSVVRVPTLRTRGPSFNDTRLDTLPADVRSTAATYAAHASWLFTRSTNTRDWATSTIGRFHAPSVDSRPSVSICQSSSSYSSTLVSSPYLLCSGRFPREPGLAGYPFVFLLLVLEGTVCRCVTQVFIDWMSLLSPKQSAKALKETQSNDPN